jgi:hypothetical protein
MPMIYVLADTDLTVDEAITMEERVPVDSVTDSFYAAQLLERVRWAVEDAALKERDGLMPAEEADDPDQNVVTLFVGGSSSPAAADASAASGIV